MNFEGLQKAWQCQHTSAKLTINANADVLLKEVRRNQQQFRATIFWRDVREVGASALLAVVSLACGIRWHWWSLYFLAFCCFFVGAFFLVDRYIQRRKQPVTNESLQGCIQRSLLEVNHQIWLLKNVFWWYLLPGAIGFAALFAQMFWQMFWGFRRHGLAGMIEMGVIFIVMGVIFTITETFTTRRVYRINQHAVREQLTPRQQELEALLASLK